MTILNTVLMPGTWYCNVPTKRWSTPECSDKWECKMTFPARKVAEQSSECHRHSENAKNSHFDQLLIKIPRAQTFFPSKWAQSLLPRGVNQSCDMVWPVLTFSDMSTGYAASNFDQTSTIKYLLIHRVSIGLILCWRESYTSPLKGETIFVYKGT